MECQQTAFRLAAWDKSGFNVGPPPCGLAVNHRRPDLRSVDKGHDAERGLCLIIMICLITLAIAQKPFLTKLAANAALLRFDVIGAVVAAPLNEGSAKIDPIVAVQTKFSTPFDDMPSPENILVVGAAPDQEQRGCSYGIKRPINDGTSTRNFDFLAQFFAPWGDKEGDWFPSVGEAFWYSDDWPIRAAPIDLNSHVFGRCSPAIFPARDKYAARQIEAGIIPIAFGQPIPRHSLGVSRRCQFCNESVKRDKSPFTKLELSFASEIKCDGCPTQDDSRDRQNGSKKHQPFIVAGNGFFGGLMPFFYGLGVGAIGIYSVAFLLLRYGGVKVSGNKGSAEHKSHDRRP